MECESIPQQLRKIILSTEEYEARLATALQTPGKMQVTTYENEQGQLVLPAPSPVIQMGNLDLAGRLRPNITNAAGEVTEASGAGTLAQVLALRGNVDALNLGMPLSWDAAGAAVPYAAARAWLPILPVTVTAGVAGSPPPTVIIPLVAASQLDVMLWMTCDQVAAPTDYAFDFRTDPLAAVGGVSPVTPNWTNIIIPLPANGTTPHNTYGHRMITDTVASAFGIAEGAGGDWPNDSNVTFYGFYRAI